MKSLETSGIGAGLVGRILSGAERFIPPLRRYMQSRRETRELPRLMDAVTAHFYRQMVNYGYTTSHEDIFDFDTGPDTKFSVTETWYRMHTFSRTPTGDTYYAELRWQELHNAQRLSLEVSRTFPEGVDLPVAERIFRIEKSAWNGANTGSSGQAVNYDFWNMDVIDWNKSRYSQDMTNSEAISFLKELLKTAADHDEIVLGYENNQKWLSNHPQLKAVFWNRGKHPDMPKMAPF